jgi:ATP sulfurylase
VISFNDHKAAKRRHDGIELLRPVIDARRKGKTEGERSVRLFAMFVEKSPTPEQIDFLSWIMDVAKGEEGDDWSLFERIMGLNFAAIHTSSMVGL